MPYNEFEPMVTCLRVQKFHGGEMVLNAFVGDDGLVEDISQAKVHTTRDEMVLFVIKTIEQSSDENKTIYSQLDKLGIKYADIGRDWFFAVISHEVNKPPFTVSFGFEPLK